MTSQDPATTPPDPEHAPEPVAGAAGPRLRVLESRLEDVDQGLVRVDSATFERLRVRPGDVVRVEGERSTVARVYPTLPEHERRHSIRTDGLLRENAGVGLDGRVTVWPENVAPAMSLVLSPTERHPCGADEVRRIREHLAGRVVSQGDKVKVPLFSRRGTLFRVVLYEPEGPGAVCLPHTDVRVQEPPRLAPPPQTRYAVKYEDIGGLDAELLRIREMIELPMKYPELFGRLRIDPPKGVLMYGPPGTGKTTIARAVAGEVKAHFIKINGPEVIHKFYGESEAKIREIFEEAQRRAPSIIFLDEIDAVAPKRSEVTGEVEKRVVAQLLALMDGMVSRGEVVVIGATNLPEVLDHALRRPGRFDREVVVRVPNRLGRLQVLKIHSRGMPLAEDVDLERLAEITHGFVGADLEVLCKEAGMRALQEVLEREDFAESEVSDLAAQTRIGMGHFIEALKGIEPTATREFFAERPNVRWADLGGLGEAIGELRAAVELPHHYPELCRAAGTPTPRGILIRGAAGTGKTMLVRALATETGFSFITVDAAALFSKWVGESEKALRQVFVRAKQASPCILFFDELDTIFPARGAGMEDVGRDRLLGQFLSELDGLDGFSDVVVVGATHRMELVEQALLNPGRLGMVIELPLPDAAAREAILRVHTRGMPLEPNVDFGPVVALSEGMNGADLANLCRRASFGRLQAFVARHGEAAEQRAGEFRLRTEDFVQAARAINGGRQAAGA